MAAIFSKRHIVSGLAAALLFIPTVADAATSFPCAPRDQIVSVLTQQFKEKPEAIGLTLDGVLLEVFVSDAQSWTVLLTTSSGLSCIAAAGENWERQTRKPDVGI